MGFVKVSKTFLPIRTTRLRAGLPVQGYLLSCWLGHATVSQVPCMQLEPISISAHPKAHGRRLAAARPPASADQRALAAIVNLPSSTRLCSGSSAFAPSSPRTMVESLGNARRRRPGGWLRGAQRSSELTGGYFGPRSAPAARRIRASSGLLQAWVPSARGFRPWPSRRSLHRPAVLRRRLGSGPFSSGSRFLPYQRCYGSNDGSKQRLFGRKACRWR
jgi:hypothetical protein